MANIQVLDQNTINQIAAGEVIERPASVVKELLENAIDAKATAVTVEVKDGGLSLIRVTDNGCGIPKEEIPLAFLRHATSKIQTVEDLFTVASLGFRGEALSSIASVAQVELITKTADSMSGSRYQIEGGEEKSLEEVGAPEGTTFIARNLFYNTPARRKFLKTPTTEGAHVADLVEKIALSHPEVSIRLIQNNQSRLHTSGNHNLKDIIYSIFGREIASNLLPVEIGEDPVRITGYIGKPLVARGNRNFENYFINGRYIKSSLINKAIEDAYKPFMMQHKYPFTMLQFTIDPTFLDVNVHPAKMELRFREGDMIYKMVYHTVSMALSHKELIPEVELGKEKNSGQVLKPVVPSEHPEPFERRRLADEQRRMQMERKNSESGQGASARTETGSRYEIPSAAAADLSAIHEPDGEYRSLFGGRNQGSASGLGGEPGNGRNNGISPRSLKPVLPGGSFPAAMAERAEAADGTDAAGGAITADAESGAANTRIDGSEMAGSGMAGSGSTTSEASGTDTSAKAEFPSVKDARQLDLFEEKLLTKPARAEHNLIGQLFDTYWLVQFKDNLYIIDQHAAHEKVLYERTMASLKNREYTSQLINPPIILTLNSGEELMLKKYLEHFTAVGFEIEPFGGKEYAVRAVPANLFSIAKKDLLMEMLDGLSDGVERGTPDSINERIASMSCKAAVKGNHAMSAAEANQLIDELLELENPYACPHGRPTIISMSKYELEKKFKRIV